MTEERMKALINEHFDLGHEPNFDAGFADAGVSSLNAVALMKVVEREFDLTMSPEEWAQTPTLRHLVDRIDSRSG